MSLSDRIQIDPKIMLGKPVIRGSRVTLELVLRKLSEGAKEEELLIAYPHLSADDIRAALAYAADSLAHEEVILHQPLFPQAMRAMQFLADESCDFAVVRALRGAGLLSVEACPDVRSWRYRNRKPVPVIPHSNMQGLSPLTMTSRPIICILPRPKDNDSSQSLEEGSDPGKPEGLDTQRRAVVVGWGRMARNPFTRNQRQ